MLVSEKLKSSLDDTDPQNDCSLAILYVTDHKCRKRNVQKSQVESGGKDIPDGVRGAAPAWGRQNVRAQAHTP